MLSVLLQTETLCFVYTEYQVCLLIVVQALTSSIKRLSVVLSISHHEFDNCDEEQSKEINDSAQVNRAFNS